MNSNELKWKRFRSVRTCWPNISGSPDTENRQGAHEPLHLLRRCSTDPSSFWSFSRPQPTPTLLALTRLCNSILPQT